MIAFIVGVFFMAQLCYAGGPSDEVDQPDFANIIRTYDESLAVVASDVQARAFFTAHLFAALGLKENYIVPPERIGPHAMSDAVSQPLGFPDTDDVAVRLTADLAYWRLALILKEAADDSTSGKLRTALERSLSQQKWLLVENERISLHHAVRLALALSSFPAIESTSPPAGYTEYAAYLDRAYRLIGSEDSWLNTAEQEGIGGIRRRLQTASGKLGQGGISDVAEGQQEALASQYFWDRLRPVFTAHLVAVAIRAEIEAEQRVHADWRTLLALQTQRMGMYGLTRLCGSWQWTIHNHQNHQDHKMIMVFPPPGETVKGATRPDKIVVLGDVVYVRWEFPGSYQEDSLLFTGKGQRLEGSFINSTGAWGAITGKRMSACGKPK